MWSLISSTKTGGFTATEASKRSLASSIIASAEVSSSLADFDLLEFLLPRDLDLDLVLDLLLKGSLLRDLDLLLDPDPDPNREEPLFLEPDSSPLSIAIKHKKSETEDVQAYHNKFSS